MIKNEGSTSLSLFFCTIVPLFCGWCTKSTFFLFPDRFTRPQALSFAVLLVPTARAFESFCRIRWMDWLKPKILTEDNSSERPDAQLFAGGRSFQLSGLCSCTWCGTVRIIKRTHGRFQFLYRVVKKKKKGYFVYFLLYRCFVIKPWWSTEPVKEWPHLLLEGLYFIFFLFGTDNIKNCPNEITVLEG